MLRVTPWLALCALDACATPATSTDESAVLTVRTYIAASYQDVWDRFTRAEAFAEWYTVPCRKFGLEPGDELIWAVGERVFYRGRMLEAERGVGISWEFRFEGFGFGEPMSRVDFEIVERGPTVLVSVRHDLSAAPQTAAMISPVGWAKPLSRLKTLLETGTPMPWPVEPGSR